MRAPQSKKVATRPTFDKKRHTLLSFLPDHALPSPTLSHSFELSQTLLSSLHTRTKPLCSSHTSFSRFSPLRVRRPVRRSSRHATRPPASSRPSGASLLISSTLKRVSLMVRCHFLVGQEKIADSCWCWLAEDVSLVERSFRPTRQCVASQCLNPIPPNAYRACTKKAKCSFVSLSVRRCRPIKLTRDVLEALLARLPLERRGVQSWQKLLSRFRVHERDPTQRASHLQARLL